MKKTISLLMAIFVVSLSAYAQGGFLEDNQVIARLTLKDGTVKEGVVEFDEDPYRTQSGIRFFDIKLLDAGQVKNKDKEKYTASEIKSIRTEDKRYEVKRYADMSAASFSSLGKSVLLEVVKPGRLTLYNYYAELGAKPELLIGKEGEEKAKAVASSALKPFIEDCARIKEKFEKGEYGNDPKDDNALMNNNLKFVYQIQEEYNASCPGK